MRFIIGFIIGFAAGLSLAAALAPRRMAVEEELTGPAVASPGATS